MDKNKNTSEVLPETYSLSLISPWSGYWYLYNDRLMHLGQLRTQPADAGPRLRCLHRPEQGPRSWPRRRWVSDTEQVCLQPTHCLACVRRNCC